MNDILDFTDYAKPLDFKYQEETYRIPAFSKPQLQKLMAINKELVKVGGDEDDLPDTDITPKEDVSMTSEELDKTNAYFDLQDKFISNALLKKKDDSWIEVNENSLVDWPIKVKNRIMKSISDQMSATVEDDVEKKS